MNRPSVYPDERQEHALDEPKGAPALVAPRTGAEERTTWTTAAFFVLTVAVLTVSGLMLYPLLPAITGAVFLAVITRHAHRWWRGKLRSPTAAASSAILLVTVSIIGPVLLLGQYLVRQAISGMQMLQDGRAKGTLDAVMDRFPQFAHAIESSSEFFALGDAVEKLAGFIASQLVGVLSNSLAAMGQIIFMLFLLFFLYRDEEAVLSFFSRLLPLTRSEKALLMGRLGDTLRATVAGRIFVAASQGTVAAVIFSALGVHAAVVLGLLTTFLALIPSFGPYLVWLPVAIWLGVTGHWIKMAILIGTGTLIISTLDNFLYPVLVGAHLRQHTAAVFLSLLGGIWVFGVAGLVLGPLIFSATEALLAIWRARFDSVSVLDPS
jgi:predicted PurR-regulated permease PerM